MATKFEDYDSIPDIGRMAEGMPRIDVHPFSDYIPPSQAINLKTWTAERIAYLERQQKQQPQDAAES